MAKFDGKFFTGPMGAVIFKKVNNEQIVCARLAPGTIKLSEASKKSCDTFGMVSSFSAALRHSFAGELMGLQDTAMSGRLVKKVSPIMIQARDVQTRAYHFEKNSFDSLADFEYNTNSPVMKWLGTKPDVVYEEGKLSIVFPEFNLKRLKFAKGSSYCQLTVAVTIIRLEDGMQTREPLKQDLRFYADGIDLISNKRFEFEVPEGCLCVASLFLKYYGNKLLRNTKKVSPGCICGATLTGGTYIEKQQYKWQALRVKFK